MKLFIVMKTLFFLVAALGSYSLIGTPTTHAESITHVPSIMVVAAPTAGFSYSVGTASCGSATVTFTNSSSGATSYSWTFENGSPATSSATNPTVTFPSGGTFEVTLTATNADGSDSNTQSITTGANGGGSTVTLVIDPDCYASQVAWTIEDSDDNVLYSVSAGTYSDATPTNDTEIRTDLCLTDGCYDLTITDSNSDGWTGSSNAGCSDDGDFWIEDRGGNIIFEPSTEGGSGNYTNSSGNYLFAMRGDDADEFWRYDIHSESWYNLEEAPEKVKEGGDLIYDGSANLYAFRGSDEKDFWKYEISANTWTALSDAPDDVKYGGALAHNGSDYIYAFRGNDEDDFWRYSISGNSWTSLSNAPEDVKEGGSLIFDGSGTLYAFRGSDEKDFWKYNISSDSWSTLSDAPDDVKYGGSLAHNGADIIYAFRGDDKDDFWKYTISTDSWSSLADAPENVKEGGALIYDGSSYLYAFRGSDEKDYWRYDISADSWSDMADTPDDVKYGGALAHDNSNTIYAFRGNDNEDLWRYSISGNTWKLITEAPEKVKEGGAMAYDGDSCIYAFRGSDEDDFWKYVIDTDTWTSMADAPEDVKYGGSLVHTGGDYIYAFRGNDEDDFWRYSISANSWTSMANAPEDVKEGGSLEYDGSAFLYAFRGSDEKDFWKYDIGANSWSTLSDTPDDVKYGGAIVYDGSTYLYAFRGDDKDDFWRYTISSDTWTSLSDAPENVKEGGALTIDGSATIYAFRGSDEKDFWKYTIASDSWETLDDAAEDVKYGGALSYVGAFTKSGSSFPGFTAEYDTEFCIDLVNTWNGTADSDWNNSSNWSDGSVPTSSQSAVIATTGSNPEFDETVNICNFTVNSGSSVSFANSSGILKIAGDITNDGTLDLSNGMIMMNGSDIQYVRGNAPTFYKFKINSDDTVRLLTDMNMRGPLIPYDGVIDFNDKSVTLLGEENYTGSIGEITSNADIVGNVITIQRYFPSSSGSWRMLCTPIQNATFEQWNDDIVTTGFPGADYPTYPSADNPWSNVRYYDETYFSGDEADLDAGFESIGNITDVIGNTLGYFVYLVPEPTTVDVTGEFLKGDKNFELDFTESNSIAFNDGWNLVANPYPSAIDWDAALGWSTSDVNNAIYAFDPVNGQYSSYVNGISVGSLTNEIASSQAFWVKSESGTPSIDIAEKAKINTTGVHMRAEDLSTVATIRIRLTGEEQWDETVVGFNTNSSQEFDEFYDAYKFYSSNEDLPNLATVIDSSDAMSINLIPVPEQPSEIDLVVKKGAHEELTLENVFVDSFDHNLCMTLVDHELDVTVAFDQGDEYVFVMGEESVEERFSILISAPLQTEETHESCMDVDDGTIVVDGFGDAPWHYIWKNAEGDIIQETEDAITSDSMEDLSPGFYEVIVMNNSLTCNIANKAVEIFPAMEEAMAATVDEFTCLGMNDGEIKVNLDQEYDYTLSLYSMDNGDVIEIEQQFNDTTFTNLAAGVYKVAAVSTCGNELVKHNLNVTSNQSVEAIFVPESNVINLATSETAEFVNSSTNAFDYIWKFGDGIIDTVSVNASHYYNAVGEYMVQLIAQNDDCSHSMMMPISVIHEEVIEEDPGTALSLHDVDWENTLNIIYEPEAVIISSQKVIDSEVVLSIFNGAGQLVVEERQDQLGGTPIEVRTGHLAQGVFYINLSIEDTLLHSDKFVKN